MSVVGIWFGDYFTNKDINELMEKFYNWYIVYGAILVNSIFKGVEYLKKMKLKNK